MAQTVDLYGNSYGHYSGRVYAEIREESYGEDLGQTGWITAFELESFLPSSATPESQDDLTSWNFHSFQSNTVLKVKQEE